MRGMHVWVAATLLVVVCGCTTLDPAAAYYGNTLYVMPAMGGDQHYIYYHRDGTFEIVFEQHRYRGTYAIRNGDVCLTAVRPGTSSPTTKCHGFDARRKVGGQWTESSADGVTNLRLEAGHTGRP